MRKMIIPAICLLVIIASCSKKTSVPVATAEKAIDAASIFSNNCARCHGADGTTGRAPNLAKAGMSGSEIADVIRNGKGRMPEFTSKLSANEIGALSAYVAKLSKD